ncbi:MAG: metallophosphoesterase [Candidatus Pacearchaeota archaeon]
MKDYKFINKAVWSKKEKILIIADLHIGFEESLVNKGMLLPLRQYEEIKKSMKEIFNKIKGNIKKIIILGDLKHEFGEISSQEWREVLDFLDFLSKICKRIVLIKGNHDTTLKPIAEKKGLEIKDFYISGENCFLHGDKIFKECFDKKIKRIFLGHKHPAITICEGVKKETYKCFLVGKWIGKEIVVLPSFFPLTEGVDAQIEESGLALPLKFSGFEVYVPVSVDKKVLKLGKVKDVGNLMN